VENSSRLKTVIEVVGLVSVVGSLLFVGLEIREGTRATRSATQQALQSSASEATAAVLDNPALLDLLVRVEADTSLLNDVGGTSDGLMLDFYFVWTFNFMENAHYHFINGTLAPEIWQAHREGQRRAASSPVFRHYWRRLRAEYFDEFQALMDETVEAAEG
jgi:hypothetical protein